LGFCTRMINPRMAQARIIRITKNIISMAV
jgi:hypothetical protein